MYWMAVYGLIKIIQRYMISREQHQTRSLYTPIFHLSLIPCKQSPPWEADSSSASKEFPRISWSQNFITALKDPNICPYPEPDQTNPINFNIMFPSTSTSSKRYISHRSPHQNHDALLLSPHLYLLYAPSI
jgi:hypothetical protein